MGGRAGSFGGSGGVDKPHAEWNSIGRRCGRNGDSNRDKAEEGSQQTETDHEALGSWGGVERSKNTHTRREHFFFHREKFLLSLASHLLVGHVRGLEEVQNATHVPLPQSQYRIHPVGSYHDPCKRTKG